MDKPGPQTVGPGSLLTLSQVIDERGALTVAELGDGLPFEPRRVFVISEVPTDAERGGHANRNTHELILCVAGRFTISLDQGAGESEITLTSPTKGLHVPPLVWVRLHSASEGAVLTVIASAPYDPADRIGDRSEFLRMLNAC